MPKVHKSLEVFLRKPPPVELGVEKIESALHRLGFELQSKSGSHRRWRHPDGTVFDYAIRDGQTIEARTVKKMATEIRKRELGE